VKPNWDSISQIVKIDKISEKLWERLYIWCISQLDVDILDQVSDRLRYEFHSDQLKRQFRDQLKDNLENLDRKI
jgi:CTP:phosphocholine cytidylyltransferase-like protein